VSGRRGLIKGARPGSRRIALYATIIAGVLSFALFIVVAIRGADDADRYGRISLPGTGEVKLPEGRVALYYEERVTLGENESLDIPDGLRVVARREVTVRSQKALQNAIDLDGRSLREWGKLEIPQAGTYRVSARSRSSGFNRPAITFGKGQLEGLGKGALLSGGILGIGLLVALAALLLGRRGYEGERMSVPVAAGDSGWSPSPPPAPTPPAAPQPAAPASAGTDPVEVQLRELERRHQAGALTDADYAARRKQVLDDAFGR
jgi:hypothetical protein